MTETSALTSGSISSTDMDMALQASKSKRYTVGGNRHFEPKNLSGRRTLGYSVA